MNIATIKRCILNEYGNPIWSIIQLKNDNLNVTQCNLRPIPPSSIMSLSSNLLSCVNEQEVENLLYEYDTLLVSPVEFYNYVDACAERLEFDSKAEKHMFFLLSEFRHSQGDSYDIQEEALFERWIFKGLKKYNNAMNLFLTWNFPVLYAEFLRDRTAHFLYKKNEEECIEQERISKAAKNVLTPELFGAYVYSCPDHMVIGSGHKPAKSVVIRYLQKHRAWCEWLMFSDRITRSGTKYQFPPEIYLGNHHPFLTHAFTNVPIPDQIMRFVNSKITSRFDSHFSPDVTKVLTAGEAKTIWQSIVASPIDK